MNEDHIAQLESEIRYLKGLLDENGIPYDYQAFVEAVNREVPVEIELPVLFLLSRAQGCVCEAKFEKGILYAMQEFLDGGDMSQGERRKGKVPRLFGKGL